MDMTQAMNARREFNDFSKAMAQFYMTVTSGATVYDRAKEAGHSDRTAGMITLGTLVGLNRLMSTEYGQYALRGIGLDDVSLNVGQVINREAREIASAYTANILNGAAAQPSTKWKAIKEISDVIFAGFKKAVDNPRTLLNSSLNEMLRGCCYSYRYY
jgi:Zn-dependent oligopeptidase